MSNFQEVKYHCSECGSEVDVTDEVCPTCGADMREIEEKEVPNRPTFERYPALRTIAASIDL